MKKKTEHTAQQRGKPKSAKNAGGKNGIPWNDLQAKQKIYLKIMHDILKDPDLGKKYLSSDKEARKAFEDAGMDVPANVKVVFVAPGDSDQLGAGSAVIELPRATGTAPTDPELLELFLCTYTIVW